LYRGTNAIPKKINRATYYSANIITANSYIPSNKKGYLNIYRCKNDIKLFKFDSLSNINKLLKDSFTDSKFLIPPNKLRNGTVLPGVTLYDLLKIIFARGQAKWAMEIKDDKPIQLTKLIRHSGMNYDLVFANWLCDNNFNGYEANNIKDKFGTYFPAETMICKPLDDLILVESIEMKRENNHAKLLKIKETIPVVE